MLRNKAEWKTLREAHMTFEEMIPEIEKEGINLYGMAFYRDGKIQELS